MEFNFRLIKALIQTITCATYYLKVTDTVFTSVLYWQKLLYFPPVFSCFASTYETVLYIWYLYNRLSFIFDKLFCHLTTNMPFLGQPNILFLKVMSQQPHPSGKQRRCTKPFIKSYFSTSQAKSLYSLWSVSLLVFLCLFFFYVEIPCYHQDIHSRLSSNTYPKEEKLSAVVIICATKKTQIFGQDPVLKSPTGTVCENQYFSEELPDAF